MINTKSLHCFIWLVFRRGLHVILEMGEPWRPYGLKPTRPHSYAAFVGDHEPPELKIATHSSHYGKPWIWCSRGCGCRGIHHVHYRSFHRANSSLGGPWTYRPSRGSRVSFIQWVFIFPAMKTSPALSFYIPSFFRAYPLIQDRLWPTTSPLE